MSEPIGNDGAGEETTTDVSRRSILLGLGALATASAASVAFADVKSTHVNHGAHGEKHAGLAGAVRDCVAKGQTCIHHCLEEFKGGSTELAACAARVQEMNAMCQAFAYFVAADAPRLKELSSVCAEVCRDCEKECRKHEDKHTACKECAEACARVVKAIETTLA